MGTQAYILVNVVLGTEDEVSKQILSLPQVLEAHVTMGSYDVIALVTVEETKDLTTLVTNSIRSIDGVRQTLTLLIT